MSNVEPTLPELALQIGIEVSKLLRHKEQLELDGLQIGLPALRENPK